MNGETVLLGLIGAFFAMTGAWAFLSPRSALQSNYRWDRRLADEMGIRAPSLFKHVVSKEELGRS